MVGLVKLMGILMVGLGAVYLLDPARMTKIMGFWVKGKRVYLGGLLNFLIGIVFLLAASRCVFSWFVAALGIVSLIKGILLFVLGPKKIVLIVDRLTKSSRLTLQTLAFLVLGIGVLLIYSA